MVTPANPKVPSTEEPPEGMFPPGPRKTVGGQPKPSTSAQQRLKPKPKPIARSVREAQAELKRVLAQKREEERRKAAARLAKKSGQKAPKGRVKKARYRNCCPKADQAVPKIHGTSDQEAALPAIGTGNCM